MMVLLPEPFFMSRPTGARTVTVWLPGINNQAAATCADWYGIFCGDGAFIAVDHPDEGYDIAARSRLLVEWLHRHGFERIRLISVSMGTLSSINMLRLLYPDPGLTVLTPIFLDPVTDWSDQAVTSLPQVLVRRLLGTIPSIGWAARSIGARNERRARHTVVPELGVAQDRIDAHYKYIFGQPVGRQLAAIRAMAEWGGVRPGEFAGNAVVVCCEADQMLRMSGAIKIARAFTKGAHVMTAPGTTHGSTVEHPQAWRNALLEARAVANRVQSGLNHAP